MPVPLEQFVKHLADSGILDGETLKDFLPPHGKPRDAEELARQLIRRKKLTKFQAEEVSRGKGQSLVLGKYVVLDKIGAGGMGQVFKAEHRRMKRIVAVKVLPSNMMKNPAVVARFEREVTTAARLNHPNIVTAFDASNVGGLHLLVMEYVEGSDLAAHIKRQGPLPVPLAVNYVAQAARGLEAAHAEGVVHRDIKPANLLLDTSGVVKILDMGLARIGGDAPGQAELTHTGTIMGTVDYMAPEQAVNTKTADARADIYSLGCTLFFLLTGKPPFVADTLMAKLLAHRQDPIPSIREHCSNASGKLAAVFEKMVAKRVEDRYQSMGEVISDLDRLAGGQEVSAKIPVSRNAIADEGLADFLRDAALAPAAPIRDQETESRREWIRRNQKPSLIAGSILVGLIVIVAIAAGLRTRDGGENKPPESNSIMAEPAPTADAKETVAETTLPQKPASVPAKEPPAEEADGRVALFNGKDLSGWIVKGNWANWDVDAAERVLATNGKQKGWLLTDRDFEDFNLSLEFQADPDSNSGIGILAAPDDAEIFEVQVGQTAAWPTGGVWSLPTNTVHGGFLPPAQAAQLKPAGEWNSLELEVQDRNLTFRVNDLDVSQYDLEGLWRRPGAFSALKRIKGRIALQSRAGVVRFRKIRISEIEDPVGLWKPADAQKWMAEVGALPAEQQVTAVEDKLRELNPRFQGKVARRIQGGVVTDVQFATDHVQDISPVRALSGLTGLYCNANLGHKSKLHDLSPLVGLNLAVLVCYGTEIADLSPLRGMPLVRLDIGNTQITDLSPVRGMALRELKIGLTAVSDLSPVEGMPLTHFWCWGTPLTDLSPLRGMSLRSLYINDAAISDLSPLADMPLEELLLTPGKIRRGIKLIRNMKTIVRIGHQRSNQQWLPPDEFWKKYDAGEFGPPVATSDDDAGN